MTAVSPQATATELIKRRAIRRSLAEWARYRGFEPAQHHLLIIKEIENFLTGDEDVLLLFAPPGSAKSTFVSVLFPSWYLANHPNNSILFATHSVEFAERWGRRVRNDIANEGKILGISLAEDNKAAARWSVSAGGEYYGVGAGTGISGFRADMGLGDDFFGSREDAWSENVRKKRWEWYVDDFSARLKPGAKRILMNCMTGDTPVLMAGGAARPLRDIRAGDFIASYDGVAGLLLPARVLNWVNQGPDRCFEIKMKSGITVKANARHPFLVTEDGELKWQRTASLKKGSFILRAIGGNGAELSASSATSQPNARACATPTTISTDGRLAFDRLRLILGQGVRRTCAIAMELLSRNTSAFSMSRAAFAPFASIRRQALTRAPIGATSSASITAITAKRLEGCCATTAISRLDTGNPQTFSALRLSTYEIGKDEVLEVSDCGVEDVFDIEVEGTANFIANGLISHNTRWHEDDVAGHVLRQIEDGSVSGRVISIAAEAGADDVLGRPVGTLLWDDPDGYDYGAFLRARKRESSPMMWSALYQQKPAPEEGDYFKADWIKHYDETIKKPDRATLRVYGASDYAVTADGGDYTVHCVVGLDPEGRMHLLDLWRAQTASDRWIEVFCDLVIKWKPMGWAEEQGQIRSGVGPHLDRRQRERGAYVFREAFPTRGDKAVRAQSIRGRMALEGLYCSGDAGWYPDFRRELLSFPAGKHDDQVDALGLVGQLLDVMLAGQAPKTTTNVISIGYRRIERQVEGFKTY